MKPIINLLGFFLFFSILILLRSPGIELGAVHQPAGVVHGEHVVDLGLGFASVQRVHVLDFQTVGQRLHLLVGLLFGLTVGGRQCDDCGAHDGHA